MALKICALLGWQAADLVDFQISAKSLDARDKEQMAFIYSIIASGCKPRHKTHLKRNQKIEQIKAPPNTKDELFMPPKQALPLKQQPLIIGAGPAGLFAALDLAQKGFKPLIIEQGAMIEQRYRDIKDFWQHGQLGEFSNAQFGEGGAGTFSDGKLTFRGKDSRARFIMEQFIKFGADPNLLYWHKPHLGSDMLRQIIPRLREQIIALGGQFYFDTCLKDLQISPKANGFKLEGIELSGKFAGQIPCSTLILATGNGARAIYRLLAKYNIALEAKPLAIGFRIEHSQDLIDNAQYGAYAGHAALEAATYQLKYHDAKQRAYYSFCMCPGGHIINAASAAGGLLTNGISNAARNSGRANSALVAAISPDHDFDNQPLAGLEFQEKLEQAAFKLGGSDYSLPCCLVEDFLLGQKSAALPADFKPFSYGAKAVNLRGLLSEDIENGLISALNHWDQKLKGFKQNAVLAAIESRTSAPLRILRDAAGQSLNLAGLYPCGEGAGYAGGIMSSAIDGLKAAAAWQENQI